MFEELSFCLASSKYFSSELRLSNLVDLSLEITENNYTLPAPVLSCFCNEILARESQVRGFDCSDFAWSRASHVALQLLQRGVIICVNTCAKLILSARLQFFNLFCFKKFLVQVHFYALNCCLFFCSCLWCQSPNNFENSKPFRTSEFFYEWRAISQTKFSSKKNPK